MDKLSNIERIQFEQAQKRLEMLQRQLEQKELEIKEEREKNSKRLADADLVYMMLTSIIREISEEEPYFSDMYTEGANVSLLHRLQTMVFDLKQEKFRAENNAKLKSEFLANMSHEIRTPMNGIVGVTKLLKSTSINEKQKEYLKAIESSGDTLMAIINDILDISKIEAGKLVIEKKEFSLPQVLSSVIELFEIKAAEKRILLKRAYQVGDLPGVLLGDVVRLNQVLFNLIGNAVKFTKRGAVTLGVEKLSEIDGQITLRFEVKDTGIGIPKNKQRKIFNAFSQANSSTTRKYGGTGLGLTIVKRLVDMQGGQVYVESIEGEGTSFFVELTYQKANSDTVGEQLIEQQFDFRGLEILLVEDNPVNQLVGKDLLEAIGAKITIAENGLVALESLQKKNFSIVLMDMQMPVMDGYEAIEKIRAGQHQSKIPIIALTAHVAKGELERCLAHGANDYLSKPYLPKDLYTRIANQLEKRHEATLGEFHEIEHVLDAEPHEEYFEALKNYVGGNDKLAHKILDKIKKQFPVVIEGFSKALQEKSFSDIASFAHQVKPNVQMLGLVDFYNEISQLELDAKQSSQWDHVVTQAKRVVQELNQLLETLNKA